MMLDPSMKGLVMKFSSLRSVALYAAALIAANSAFAVVAQEPLLSKTVNVRPNIALVLDTRAPWTRNASMPNTSATRCWQSPPTPPATPGFHVDCISGRGCQAVRLT